MSSDIQAVLFDKSLWSDEMARGWLKRHKLKPIKKVHITDNYLRYRIRSPIIYSKFSITKESGGVRFVLGSF